MKTPDTSLHQLVHSLSKSEKRYVKLFSVHDKDSYAIKLFDLIESQPVYDESEIKQKLRNEPFIDRFAEVKLYLQNVVLNALTVYHRESSVDNEIRNHLSRIEILFKKGLLKLCENVLIKTRKLAEEYERFSYLAELNRWELELLRAKSFTGISEKEFSTFYDGVNRNIEKLQNANDFLRLSMMFFLKRQKAGYIRKKSDADIFSGLLNSPLVSDKKKAISFNALSHYYLNRFSYYYMIYDYKKAYDFINDLVNEFLQRPKLMQDKQVAYMMSLFNLGMCQIKNGFFSEVAKTLTLLDEFSLMMLKKHSELPFYIKILKIKLELECCNLAGDYEKAIAISKSYFEKIKNGDVVLSEEDKLNICFQLLKAYLYKGEYGLAKRVLNFSISNIDNAVRADLHSMMRIINMIIYFDTKDEEALESAYKSAKKYLTKRNVIYQVENIMLDFFKKQLTGEKNKEIYLKSLHSLKRDFLQLQGNPYEKQSFYLFDFNIWVDGKLKHKTNVKL